MPQSLSITEKDNGLASKLAPSGLLVFCQFTCLFDTYVEVKTAEPVDGG